MEGNGQLLPHGAIDLLSGVRALFKGWSRPAIAFKTAAQSRRLRRAPLTGFQLRMSHAGRTSRVVALWSRPDRAPQPRQTETET